MRICRVGLVLLTVLPMTGCGLVHFGRRPPAAVTDAKAAEAYSNLTTEHKILQQELLLARREKDMLRAALDRSGAAPTNNHSAELASRLSETASELAALRVSYAKLQADRAAARTSSPEADRASSGLEDRLARTLSEYTALQAENARLQGEVERTRMENANLADRLRAATARYDQAQAAVAQLNAELGAQKDARVRAERSGEALRAQLSTVMAQPSAPTPISGLQGAKAPPAGASPVVELRVQTERLRPTATTSAPVETKAAEPSQPKLSRRHTVAAGDTLEKISQQYYGVPDRWVAIYTANNDALGSGQPLRTGMELTIPD